MPGQWVHPARKKGNAMRLGRLQSMSPRHRRPAGSALRLGRMQSMSPRQRRTTGIALIVRAALSVSVLVPLLRSAADAATVVTDFSDTFESGATHGWVGNGITAENAAVGATAHGGTGVLSVHDKTGWGV